jgi:hypothetical protein
MNETDEPPLREIIGTADGKHLLECGHWKEYEEPKRACRCAECGGDVWSETIEDFGETIEEKEL